MKNFNDWLAIKITDVLSTMWAAYAATILAIIGNPGLHATIQQWVQWFSQTFTQLVMLFVLMVAAKIGNQHIKKIHKHLGIDNERLDQ
jgi:succinate dehydrogenase hydrophobic anchor subunit